MAAWGTPGGGPLTTQQVDNLIDFMHSIQLDPDELQAQITEELERSIDEGEFGSMGEAIFNYGLVSGADAGTYSCGRCHTPGWSYGDPGQPGGGGTIGFSLRDGATLTRFPTAEEHAEFIIAGSENGIGYGVNGQGSGRMPAFGAYYTEEQISEVVDYERGL
jgi:mono/diheme cytochrome c family protein